MADIIGNNIIKANLAENENVISAQISQNHNTINGGINGVPCATTTRKGIIRIATDEEAIEGINEQIAITPKTLKLATHYTHIQGEASATWVIHHNLNKKPSITIVDSADNVVEGAEKYIDENTVEIYFNGAFKGKAYLN